MCQVCVWGVPPIQIRRFPARRVPPALATPVTADKTGARVMHAGPGNTRTRLEIRHAQTAALARTLRSRAQVRAWHVPPMPVRLFRARPRLTAPAQ